MLHTGKRVADRTQSKFRDLINRFGFCSCSRLIRKLSQLCSPALVFSISLSSITSIPPPCCLLSCSTRKHSCSCTHAFFLNSPRSSYEVQDGLELLSACDYSSTTPPLTHPNTLYHSLVKLQVYNLSISWSYFLTNSEER